jgi:hypothetical protein
MCLPHVVAVQPTGAIGKGKGGRREAAPYTRSIQARALLHWQLSSARKVETPHWSAVTVRVTFDKETWAKAKPLFIQAAKEFKVAASDVNQLARLLIKDLHVNYKMTEQAIKEMRVYLMRFISEVRAGTISLEEEVSAR